MKWILLAFSVTVVALRSATAQTVGRLSDSAAHAFYAQHAADYALEAHAIAAAHGRAERDGSRLSVTLRNGQRVTFVDTLAEGDEHHRFLYHQFLPALGVHDIELWFYEGRTHVLVVERTGRERIVPGPPVLSPTGQRFVAASRDLEANYEPNRLEIWRATKQGIVREFVLDGRRGVGSRFRNLGN